MDALLKPNSTLLDVKSAAEVLHLSPTTLDRWRSQGIGPVFYKIGGRVFYRREDLDAFIEINRSTSATEARQRRGSSARRLGASRGEQR